MDEDRRGIRVGLISVRQVADAIFLCEEVALNRFALSTFAICDSIEDGVSLCRLILDL